MGPDSVGAVFYYNLMLCRISARKIFIIKYILQKSKGLDGVKTTKEVVICWQVDPFSLSSICNASMKTCSDNANVLISPVKQKNGDLSACQRVNTGCSTHQKGTNKKRAR